ncbi:MobF family relaxase [Cellulomonas sp. Y8]|uniref:MobF family relaxase n=1 Tax=Cellulomonas sp. Y8 TaxID=2591145 RepID=UPI0011C8D7DF|nr:MobF family relaxase [Cellulomonas sp. Y8]
MTVHVLHAGDGYTYLTRQVATGDVPRQRGEDLSAYYTASGNPPGRWVGEGLDSLGVSGRVTEAQMKALFGEGRHPDADAIERALVAGGASVKDAMAATRLGRRFMLADRKDDDGFIKALRDEHAEFRARHDRDAEPGVERDGLRRSAAARFLTAKGEAATPAAVGKYLAARGGAERQPVAGYDLVFTPVKSVSVLWGLGDEHVRGQVLAAHEDAWRGALSWLESQAALTRVGAGGVAQVDTRGFAATTFDHFDSRSGDPNLHTHVAVSNKVLGLDGKWRSLDGRVIHALGVAASERYNTLVETGLRSRLGVRFVERSTGRAARRPVREIDGIPVELNTEFSRRRESIEATYKDLVADYRARHGHEPPRPVQHKLAQQATLTTRAGKETGVSQETRRAQWMPRAIAVLGSPEAVERTLAATQNRPAPPLEAMPPHAVLADQVLTELMTTRATWKYNHVLAESQRVARQWVDHVGPESVQALAEVLTDRTLAASIRLTPPEPNPVPAALQRVDTTSVYVQHAGAKYTANPILDAEDRLLAAARRPGGLVIGEDVVARHLAGPGASPDLGRAPLDPGQAELVRQFATGGRLLQVAVGPAGAGKTTAMRAFTRTVQDAGGTVIALAPAANAAALLGKEIGVEAYSIHAFLARQGLDPDDAKLLRGPIPADLPAGELTPSTIVLIDEAGMAATPHLDAVVRLAAMHGASVRAVGDWAQLQAVGAGGALRLIDEQVGGAHLVDVHRFKTPGEAQATLRLRSGDLSVIDDFYAPQGRLRGGSIEAMTEEMYAHWWADHTAGRDAVMIAQANTDVVALAARARKDLVDAGMVAPEGVRLHDDNTAGVGDHIVSRLNDTDLKMRTGTDYVRNGATWTVLATNPDGSLRARSIAHGAQVDLPAAYVAEHVELAYASTVNRTQGMTVTAGYALVTERMGRDGLYPAMTRGTHTNMAFVVVEDLLDVDPHPPGAPPRAVREAMASAMGASDDTPSATATTAAEAERVVSLATTHPAYEDALARVLDPGRDDRMADVVRTALPDYAAELVLEDDAWPTLRDVLAAHERTGQDLEHLLSSSFAEREIDTAQSVARVMWHRVGAPELPAPSDARLPSWVSPAPDPGGHEIADADVARWAARQVDEMASRVDQLVDRVAEHPPAWAENLHPRPEHPGPERAAWETDMRTVVAYRDRWDIRDDTEPVPADNVAGIRKAARDEAERAASRLQTDTPNPEAGVAAERTALAERSQAAVQEARRAAQQASEAADTPAHPGTTPTDERLDALRAARDRASTPELDDLRDRLRTLAPDTSPASGYEDIRALAARAQAAQADRQAHEQQQTADRARQAHVDRYERPVPPPARGPVQR